MNIGKKIVAILLVLFSAHVYGMGIPVGALAGLGASVGMPLYLKNSHIKEQYAATFFSPILTAALAYTMAWKNEKTEESMVPAATTNFVFSAFGHLGMAVADAMSSDKRGVAILGECAGKFFLNLVGTVVVCVIADEVDGD